MEIWKFEIRVGENRVSMPSGARVLTAQIQRGTLCVWALVDPSHSVESVTFSVVGTGHEFNPVGKTYVGTVQDGPLVWHVWFE